MTYKDASDLFFDIAYDAILRDREDDPAIKWALDKIDSQELEILELKNSLHWARNGAPDPVTYKESAKRFNKRILAIPPEEARAYLISVGIWRED